MTEQEKMLSGRLYSASDPFLTQQRLRARELVREICQTPWMPAPFANVFFVRFWERREKI